MNKTIYLRPDEATVWVQARKLAGDKLSYVIVSILKQFIAQKEAEVKSLGRIEIRFYDADNNDLPTAKAFYGKWVLPPDNPHKITNKAAQVEHFAVAITAKGRVVINSWTVSAPGVARWGEHLSIFESFEAAASNAYLRPAVLLARSKLGVPVEELDI